MVSIDEKKTTGASYIFSFYIGIQNLTETYSQYLNLMLELENKYGGEIEKAEDTHKDIVNNWLQTVRLHAHKCYIQYKTLVPSLKISEDKNINIQYMNIANNFVIKRDELKDFVLSMNKVLVNGVIQDILTSNQDYIKETYEKNE